MHFSTSLDSNINKSWWERFTSQPHQLFFTSSIFFAFLVMILTSISLVGKLPLDFSYIHGFGLNYAVFTNAFLGFLITVIPKYNAVPAIKKDDYLKAWIFLQITFILSFFNNIILWKILTVFIILYFVKIFSSIIKKSKVIDRKDSIYINSILCLGAVLLLLESLLLSNFSTLIFFAYLLSMVFIVALKMIPSFFFAQTRIQPWQRPEYIRPLSLFFIISSGLCLEFNFLIALKFISFFASIFFSYILYKLNMFKKTPAILSILVLGFSWIALGFLALFIESVLELNILKLSLHIFALGFITTLLIGFSSRVSLGHAVPPQTIIADKLTIFIFALTQILLLIRVCASIFSLTESTIFIALLHSSAFLWIVLFSLWSFRYAKILLRI